MQKVAPIEKSCQNVSEQLVDSPKSGTNVSMTTFTWLYVSHVYFLLVGSHVPRQGPSPWCEKINCYVNISLVSNEHIDRASYESGLGLPYTSDGGHERFKR